MAWPIYEDFIRDVARKVLDQALARGEFDFVSEISRELPIRFLCSIFTVPQDDAPEADPLGRQMIANQDPELSASWSTRTTPRSTGYLQFRSPAALEVFAYAAASATTASQQPTDDVISALTLAEREGVLTERELPNYFAVLMIAGNETTRHTITGRHARVDPEPRSAPTAEGRPHADRRRDRGAPALGDRR